MFSRGYSCKISTNRIPSFARTWLWSTQHAITTVSAKSGWRSTAGRKILHLLQSKPNAHSTVLLALVNMYLNIRLAILKFRCGYGRNTFPDKAKASSPTITKGICSPFLYCRNGPPFGMLSSFFSNLFYILDFIKILRVLDEPYALTSVVMNL